jgi:hypothetical protein
VQPSFIATTHGGSWLTVAGVPVSRANELLGASYYCSTTVLGRTRQFSERRLCTPRGDAHSRCNGLHVYATYTCSRCTNDGRHRQPSHPTRPLQQTPHSRSGGAAAQVATAASGEPMNALFRRNLYIKPSSLSVQDVRLFSRRDGPECARDCGLRKKVPESRGSDCVRRPILRQRRSCDLHFRAG